MIIGVVPGAYGQRQQDWSPARGLTAMETQSITLAIPKDLWRRVEQLAVSRHTSISALLVEILQQWVDREDAFVRARRRHLRSLEQGADLGTGGRKQAARDELHDRG